MLREFGVVRGNGALSGGTLQEARVAGCWVSYKSAVKGEPRSPAAGGMAQAAVTAGSQQGALLATTWFGPGQMGLTVQWAGACLTPSWSVVCERI